MELKEEKVGIGAYISLVLAILMFSGLLGKVPGILSTFDINNMMGAFGKIGEAGTFRGTGGTGAKDALMLSFQIIPSIILTLGIMNIFIRFGALRAAQQILSPIMRPILGVPGVGAFLLVSGLQSTDGTADIIKQCTDSGMLKNKERLILDCWLYPSTCIVVNFLGTGAPLFGSLLVSSGLVLGVIILMKFVGANVIRALIHIKYKGADIDVGTGN